MSTKSTISQKIKIVNCFFLGFRILRIFLDQKPYLATYEWGMGSAYRLLGKTQNFAMDFSYIFCRGDYEYKNM